MPFRESDEAGDRQANAFLVGWARAKSVPPNQAVGPTMKRAQHRIRHCRHGCPDSSGIADS